MSHTDAGTMPELIYFNIMLLYLLKYVLHNLWGSYRQFLHINSLPVLYYMISASACDI